ncbi:MAG: alpha/beta hydrolase, partial [Parvularculaceae bacterium]|nr:alpha/beta hydrolase [Parvularculaceae bacterium]
GDEAWRFLAAHSNHIVREWAAILVGAFLILRTPDTDRAAMIKKYGGPSPLFAEGFEGLKVHWRDEGCRDCPALVLLHGSNASLQTWEILAGELKTEFRVVTLDLPGHGLTGRHPRDDYSARGMMEAVDAVAAAAGLEQFALGGNSMGGWVAWRYALAHKERVSALILLDAAGMPAREGDKAPASNIGFRLLRSPIGRALAEQITPRPLVKQSLLQSVSRKDIVTEQMIDRYWELLRFPGNRRATVMRAKSSREPEMAARIGDIKAPTLIIWGREDRLIPVSAATTFKERLPQAETMIFDGVGHIPMEEAPEATAAAIRTFLVHETPPGAAAGARASVGAR